jgi:hypothetical protein
MTSLWQCWLKRSISAAIQAAPGNTLPHCLKARFVVRDRPRAAASKLGETLATSGAVASTLTAILDGVNQRGSELVYDLHWLRRRGSNPRPGG